MIANDQFVQLISTAPREHDSLALDSLGAAAAGARLQKFDHATGLGL